MAISVREVEWTQAKEMLAAIRRSVFIDEQGVTEAEEWDALDSDPNTKHFMATLDETPVACARLLAGAQIGRMAVLKPQRGKGIGAAVLRAVLEKALELTPRETPWLNAQVPVIPFYQRFGFVPEDSIFLDAGLPHQRMHFSSSCSNLQRLYGDRVLRLTDARAFIQHICQSAECASRSLSLLSDSLSPEIWGQPEVSQAVSQFARRSRQSTVRILVKEPKGLVGNHHPLVNLYQRLRSHLDIRILRTDEISLDHSYLIADNMLVYFNHEHDLTGFANYSAAAECQHLLDAFNRCWNYGSDSDPELREFFL